MNDRSPPNDFAQKASTNRRIKVMDKDRIAGAAKQAKGAVKEAAGKITGDAKLEGEGKADKVAGKIQNAAGGVKDAIRDAAKK
jgi:uncharacterized protein YjbJ (UPF0337 family)